jgi:hypothetical protein
MQSRDRFTPDSGRDKVQMMRVCARWGARGPALRFVESAHVAESSRLAGGFFSRGGAESAEGGRLDFLRALRVSPHFA